jgi:hypothetical protein
MQCPTERNLDSIILYVDVIGLTALCDRLSTKGDEGLESLSRSMNTCIEFLTSKVSSSGGEIFKFNGHSFLILWTPSDYLLDNSNEHRTNKEVLKNLCVKEILL